MGIWLQFPAEPVYVDARLDSASRIAAGQVARLTPRSQMEQLADLHFETHAHIKSVIGQDLITDDNVAVAELVKNSMDAEAARITVSFRAADRERGEAEIRILDDGVGMSQEDVERKWLNLAFSSKRADGQRFYAGSKGIGRFSSDRLGRELLMYTRKRGAPGIIKVVIDWETFESQMRWSSRLHEIRFKSFELSAAEFRLETGIRGFRHGTCLRIKRPKSLWGAKKLLGLKRDLERLMLPSQVGVGAGAKLFLEVLDYDGRDGLEGLAGEVRNRAFEKLPFKTTWIESMIDRKGSRIKTRLHYRGETLVEVVERNRFGELRGAKVAMFHLNQYHKAFFKRETGIRSEDYGSVFLYLNGFRVPPYGDPRNDWLGIDARRAQAAGRCLGTRDIIGRVELEDREGEAFAVTSDREGMRQSEAFTQLSGISDGFFGHALGILERFVANGLSWDKVTESNEEIENRLSLHSGAYDFFRTRFHIDDAEKNSDIVKGLFQILFDGAEEGGVLSVRLGDKVLETLARQKREKIKDFEKSMRRILSADGAKPVGFGMRKVLRRLKESHAKITNLEAERKALTERRHFICRQLDDEGRMRRIAESQTISKKQKLIEITSLLNAWSSEIQPVCESIIDKLRKNPQIVDEKTFDQINFAHMVCIKIRKLSKIIHKTNFRMMTDGANHDIFLYAEQYIEELRSVGPSVFGLNVTFSNKKNSRLNLTMRVTEISMLLDNIISNAEKHSADRLDVIVDETPEKFEIRFVDNGTGLTGKHSHDKLFEPGITTTGGSGIGLHHAKKFACDLGASISIQSNEGKGATVRLEWKK